MKQKCPHAECINGRIFLGDYEEHGKYVEDCCDCPVCDGTGYVYMDTEEEKTYIEQLLNDIQVGV
jgi:hypothetical protein